MPPDAGNGNDAAADQWVVGPAPTPFSLVARQHRWENGKLYAVLVFLTPFGPIEFWFEGSALADTLRTLTTMANATRSGVELPTGGPRA